MKKSIWGFTLIELLIVVSTVGVLSTIGVISYGGIQEKAHDRQREVRVAILKDALEKYYQDNGEYPACSAIASPVSIETAAGVLELQDPNVLTAPTVAKGTNSISCSSSDPVDDTYNYTGGNGFAIKYLVDESNTVDTEIGQHGNPLSAPSNVSATSGSPTEATVTWNGVVGAVSYNVETATNSGFTGSTFANGVTGTSKTVTGLTANQTYYFRLYAVSAAAVVSSASSAANVTTVLPVPANPSAPVIAVVLNGANVQATVTPVSCTGSTAQYGVRSRTNDGAWGAYSGWNTTLVFTQAAADGTKYGYQAQARCYESGTNYSGTVAGTESTYIDPIVAPSAPVVTANTVTTTTTWSWPAVTCTGGSARYQYQYTISPSGYNSGWVSNGASLNVAFTTSTTGQTYTVAVQAQCYNTYSTSAWSASGSANFVNPRYWKDIAGGQSYACAIDSNDAEYCWATNGAVGSLGNNSTADAPGYIAVPVDTSGVLSGKTIKYMAPGGDVNCSVASDNKPYCWGEGTTYGVLGNNTFSLSLAPVAVDMTGVLSGKTILKISSGFYHTCVIASDNKAYCWGRNSNGQLGNNATAHSSVPVAVNTTGVLSGKTILAISAGYAHTCAVASDNKVYCWGLNTNGQLGNNSTTQSLVPVAVNTTSGTSAIYNKTISAVASGYRNTCVIASSDNKPYCWGYGTYGQNGDNTTTQRLVPVAVNMASGVSALYGKTVKAISSFGFTTCVIGSDDLAYCWGRNVNGETGDNQIGTNRLVPVAVYTAGLLSGKTIKKITSGYYDTCAIASDNNAYCWGKNAAYQLGNTLNVDSGVPVMVVVP